MKTVFYQAIFNGYDKPAKPKDLAANSECSYVTQVGVVDPAVANVWNRQAKILHAPRIGDVSVYMDGNIGFAQPMDRVAAWALDVLKDGDIAICKHAARRCAYVEIEACVGRKKITSEQATIAHQALTNAGLPKNYGLWECGIIVRRVKAKWLDRFHVEWFNMMLHSGVWRDQIWLPMVLYRMGKEIPIEKFATIPMDVRNNPWFTFRSHE